MLEGYFKHFGQFPKFSEDFRRCPKTSDNFQRFKKKIKNAGWSFADFFRRLPEISEDFRKFSACRIISVFFFALFGAFSKSVFQRISNIQQRRHEPLLRPLNSFIYVINKVITRLLEINLHW